MDLQRLTIGEMAQLNNVTAETLRHYDRQELLHPFYTDEQTGYRYYHINQCARLDMIQFLQSHSIPLREIKNYLDLTDSDVICELLKKQLSYIDQSIQRLSQSRDSIKRMIANHRGCMCLPTQETVFFEYIHERKIYKHKTDINLFEQDITGYELMLRELKCSMVNNNLPASYFFNAGSIVRQEHLCPEALYSDEVFFFVEDNYDGPGNLEIFPEALYICLCSKDFSREPECAKLMLDEMIKAGFETDGDYICEVIEEFPGFAEAPRNIFYKIQVPVKKIQI